MNMKQLNVVLFAKNQFLSHRDFPLTESFRHRGISPMKVTEKFQSKGYIGNLTDSLSVRSDRSQSAVAPLLTDFVVTLEPLTAVFVIGKSICERKGDPECHINLKTDLRLFSSTQKLITAGRKN